MVEEKNPALDDSLVGESGAGFDDSSALPARLERYSVAHKRTLQVSDYIRKNERIKSFQNLAITLKDCGSYLCFHDYYTVDKVRLASASFCNKHLLCPLCSIRRGAKSLKAYVDRLNVIKTDNPRLFPYLVTFTVKNGANLTERFNHVKNSIAELQVRKRVHERGKGPHYEINKASGGVGSFEFKKGKNSGLWHPHYHAVWLCEVAPCEKILSQEWKQITGDSHIVNVTPFYTDDDVVSGFCEVFKYALKFSSMTLKDNFEGFLSLSGRRLVNSFGVFRGVVVPETNEDILLEDLPYIERFYTHGDAGYSLSRRPESFEGVGRVDRGEAIKPAFKNPSVRPNSPLNARRYVSYEVSRQDER